MKFCMPAMSQGFPINANVSCAFASNMSMIWLNTSAGAYREAFLSKMSYINRCSLALRHARHRLPDATPIDI